MYNMHDKLLSYFDENVQLSAAQREGLEVHRDANLKRLADGLQKLREEGRRCSGPYLRNHDQGGFAMRTLNQHVDGEFDLDTAVIFSEEALPSSPLDSRQLVAEAINAASGNFLRDPEARTNAVTVWYAEGHHIDLAVYRERENFWGGKVLEHAGADWTEGDPLAVNNWFEDAVKSKSPATSDGATVRPEQLRRVVSLIKAFAKSRPSWSLPGGMILSALAVEKYVADPHRDDVALYETMKAIKSRIEWWGNDVENPIDPSQMLTSKTEYENQVERLEEKLGQVLPKLDVLFDDACDDKRASRAWNHVFKHPFWKPGAAKAVAEATTDQGNLKLRVGVASKKGGKVRYYHTDDRRLPKKVWLRFDLENYKPRSDDEILWVVENTGDEAAANDDMSHQTAGKGVQWESTAYKGDHKMICRVLRDDRLVARGERSIRVRAV